MIFVGLCSIIVVIVITRPTLLQGDHNERTIWITNPINENWHKTIEHLKHLARYESFEQDKDITYVDLIRDAISNTYPVPDGDNEND